MKQSSTTVLFLLLLSFFSLPQLQGQYRSVFGQDSSHWEYSWFNLPGNAQSTAHVFGDTLVAGKRYKMLSGTYPYGNRDYGVALLREDTTEGKIWYRALEPEYPQFGSEDTLEQLLVDFSLNVGDTFQVQDIPHVRDTIVLVDSVFYDTKGRKHIVFAPDAGLPGFWGPFSMIEGVGSSAGLLFRHRPISHFMGQSLICYRRDGRQEYLSPYFGSCLVFDGSSIRSRAKLDAVKIYPNPSSGLLFIEKEEFVRIERIAIFNSLGQELLSLPYNSQIDISSLAPGFYQLILFGEQGPVAQQKLLRE